MSRKIKLFVQKEAVTTYQATRLWKDMDIRWIGSTDANLRPNGTIDIPTLFIGGLRYEICNNEAYIVRQDKELEGNLTIPNEIKADGKTYPVTTIRGWAFEGTKVERVMIGNSVSQMGEGCFSGCKQLTSVVLPQKMTKMEAYMFDGCASLQSVKLPGKLTHIGEYSFSDCTALTTVSLPKGLTILGEYSFVGCEKLHRISLPKSLEEIGADCFNSCTSLETLHIPQKVRKIGKGAIVHCPQLRLLTVNKRNATYDSREQSNAVIETATNTMVCGSDATRIPNSVTALGDYCFFWSSNAANITIPNSITTIGKSCFAWSENLESLHLPANITSIGAYGTGEVREIVFDGTIPPKVERGSHDNGVSLRLKTIYVPAEAIETYKKDDTWGLYNIKAKER